MNYTKNQWQQAVNQWSRIVELYEDAREDCNKWMDHHFNTRVDQSDRAVQKWGLNLTEEDHRELCLLENRLRLVSMQRGYAWELVDLYRRLEQSIYSVPSPKEAKEAKEAMEAKEIIVPQKAVVKEEVVEKEVVEEDAFLIAWAR